MTDMTVAKIHHPIVVLRERLEARSDEIKAALPGIPPDRFIRAVITAAQINPDILACQFQSVWLACMRACRDGLLPDGVEGAIVPFKDRATWIPMYRGLLRKFQDSGQLRWITANCVYEGDDFAHYIDEHGEHLRHVPSDTYDDKKITRVYAMATTIAGGVFISVMPIVEIGKIRNMSRTTRDDSPWKQHFTEMAKKTALRRLSKMLPTAPILEEDDDDNEPEPRPQIAAVERKPGAAAALEQFAASPAAAGTPSTAGGSEGQGAIDAESAARTPADRDPAPAGDRKSDE